MKQIFLSVAFAIISLITFAHTPTQQCSSTGWYIYLWSDLGRATSVDISWGHGQHGVNHGNGYDTVIKNLNLLPLTIFQAPVGQDVTFAFNDGYTTDFKVKAPACGSLPILLSTFVGKDIGDGAVQFKWTVSLENNVDTYEVWELTTGGEHRILSVNSLGDTETDRTYAAVYQSEAVIESRMPWWIGLCFLAMWIGLMNPRTAAKILGASLAFVMFSCNKTQFNPPTVSTTKYFRLKEVDRDGNIYSFPTIQVKIK